MVFEPFRGHPGLADRMKAVYRFCAPEIYSISHYALLAATIGDIPFYDLDV